MSDLRSRLRTTLSEGKALSDLLAFDESCPLGLQDARSLCDFLAEQTDLEPLIHEVEGNYFHTALCDLTMPFQYPADENVAEHLREHGLPELLRLCDLALDRPDTPSYPVLMIAKMLAIYAYEPGVARIAEMARRFPNHYSLVAVFDPFNSEHHPFGPDLIDLLRAALPSGLAALLTLDLANALSTQNRLDQHPFDTRDGHQRLEAWLTDPDRENVNSAVSTAASLPFISEPARGNLAALAMDHASPIVQMDAAWASAYRGSEAGIRVLARMAGDPRLAVAAQQYFTDLGRKDAIPPEVNEPTFVALATMSNWLRYEDEFGLPPDVVELFDTRTLKWPPTNDTRQLWLVRYCYKGQGKGGTDYEGVGMVGSLTFALSESKPVLSPEDIYGLHCCWELDLPERSAAAGRALLGI